MAVTGSILCQELGNGTEVVSHDEVTGNEIHNPEVIISPTNDCNSLHSSGDENSTAESNEGLDLSRENALAAGAEKKFEEFLHIFASLNLTGKQETLRKMAPRFCELLDNFNLKPNISCNDLAQKDNKETNAIWNEKIEDKINTLLSDNLTIKSQLHSLMEDNKRQKETEMQRFATLKLIMGANIIREYQL